MNSDFKLLPGERARILEMIDDGFDLETGVELHRNLSGLPTEKIHLNWYDISGLLDLKVLDTDNIIGMRELVASYEV